MVMITVPTSTVSPSSANNSLTVPAYGLGSSTAALAVSISQIIWLTVTSSPGATYQVSISASTSPSPTSGSLNACAPPVLGTLFCFAMFSLLPSHLVRERPVDSIQNADKIRKVVLFQARLRIRRVVGGNTDDGRLQVVEALLCDTCGDLRSGAAGEGRLVGDHQSAGLFHRLHDGRIVDRGERTQVDHFQGTVGVGLGRLQGGLDHGPIGEHGRVGAGA